MDGVELEINGITPAYLEHLRDVDLMKAFELICAEINQRLDLYTRISAKAKKMFSEMPEKVRDIRSNIQGDKPVSKNRFFSGFLKMFSRKRADVKSRLHSDIRGG